MLTHWSVCCWFGVINRSVGYLFSDRSNMNFVLLYFIVYFFLNFITFIWNKRTAFIPLNCFSQRFNCPDVFRTIFTWHSKILIFRMYAQNMFWFRPCSFFLFFSIILRYLLSSGAAYCWISLLKIPFLSNTILKSMKIAYPQTCFCTSSLIFFTSKQGFSCLNS